MNTTKLNYNAIFHVSIWIAVCLFGYFFPDVTLYLFLAFIVMLIGNPLASAICKIKVFNKPVPRSISAAITLLSFILILLLSVFFFVPSLIKELKVLENIDYEKLGINLNIFLKETQNLLYNNNLLPADQTLVGILVNEVNNWIDFNSISSALTSIISSAGSFFFGLFAVFFIAFFFIKDDIHVEHFIQFFFSKKYAVRLTQVVDNINHLLSRYFVGLLIKTAIMTLLLYVGFLLSGMKGALLMALIGGITNIIPYLGPFIGWGIVCIFSLLSGVGSGIYTEILPMLVKISIAFISVNTLENLVLSPLIYSQSIKAHPVEVFLVTILGGRISGIAGMILGIPVYTIIRIAGIEIYNYISGNINKQ